MPWIVKPDGNCKIRLSNFDLLPDSFKPEEELIDYGVDKFGKPLKQLKIRHYAQPQIATPGLIQMLKEQGFKTALVPAATLFVYDVQMFNILYVKHIQKEWWVTGGAGPIASILVKKDAKQPTPNEVMELIQTVLLEEKKKISYPPGVGKPFDIRMHVPRPYAVLRYTLQRDQTPVEKVASLREGKDPNEQVPEGFVSGQTEQAKGDFKMTCVEVPSIAALLKTLRVHKEEEKELLSTFTPRALESGYFVNRIIAITHLQVE